MLHEFAMNAKKSSLQGEIYQKCRGKMVTRRDTGTRPQKQDSAGKNGMYGNSILTVERLVSLDPDAKHWLINVFFSV